MCRQEANEIDTCAECYLNANSSDEWFVKVCTHPHLLLWAKLKGFPYWPAKAMGAGPNAVVNVRFFGKHDRANVPVKDCFLYCAQDPNTQTSRRSARDLAECIREVEVHIEHIKEKIGSFHYAPYRTAFDPLKEQQQLEEMMPGVHDVINRQLEPANKTPLQFLIRKTAGDKLSIVKKTKTTESGNESDQSSSPAKKSLQDSPTPSQTLAPPPVAVSDPPKVKSSNYEVIPRAGDALRESRGCTVVLKRKSLETSKTSKAMLELAVKRKHSQSDASSEASSHQGTSETSPQHRRRSKHARKQLQDTEADAHSEQEEQTEAPATTESLATEANPAVVSVVELVRRRQGVTITKIPREQQQQQTVATQLAAPVTSVLPLPPPAAAALATPAPCEPNADEMMDRQRAVERQQQQLISKVVPFVEIKREVFSEPEEGDEVLPPPPPVQEQEQEQELHQSQLQLSVEASAAKPAPSAAIPLPVSAPAATVSVPAPVALPAPPPPPPPALHPPGTVPPPAIVPLNIKEEVVSEDEMETDAQPPVVASAAKPLPEEAPPSATPPMPPPALPAVAVSPATAVLPQQNEDFVRFVGDTTIQRLIHKQSPKPAESPTNKRSSVRGVPHGPLPAAALSPPPGPSSPAPSASPKLANSNTRSTPGQSQKSPVPQQLPQQVRVKTDKSLSVLAPSPPPNLLKSNMVVIPMDTRHCNGGVGSGGITGAGIGTIGVVGANLNNSNLMTIPVPPLRAVSKNTLQAGAMISMPLPIPTPPPGAAAFGNSSVPPPPLAGLTSRSQPTTSTAVAEAAPGHLLANALNGLPSDTLVTESSSAGSAEPIVTTGVATALSELVLRSGPPKLTARPCGPLQSDGGSIYPAQAGPLSTRLKENAHKVSTRHRT